MGNLEHIEGREEKLANLAGELLKDRFQRDMGVLSQEPDGAAQIIADNLVKAMKDALTQALALQAQEKKGPVAFMSFSFLHSDLLLERFSLRLDVYDERFLLDEAEASADWDFSPLLNNVGFDLEPVYAALRKSVVRVQDYELMELRRAYLFNFYVVAIDCLTHLLPVCVNALTGQDAGFSEEVQFTAGPYMEKQALIHTWRPGA